jgi:hypothetical protein
MINCVYYNDYIRCYRDGRVERLFKITNQFGKKGEWKLCEYKTSKHGYLVIKINVKSIMIHRLIACCFLGFDINNENEIDHINRMRNDNKIDNLRIVSKSQNQWNRGAKGCCWNKREKKWTAYIQVNKKRIYLGYYDIEEEARNAYLKAKKKYHTM